MTGLRRHSRIQSAPPTWINDAFRLDNVTSLDLSFNGGIINNAAAETIASESSKSTSLTSLDLKGDCIYDNGIKALRDSKWLSNLKSFEVSYYSTSTKSN